MNSRYRLVLFLALLFAAGCGQKGPLYLPGDPSEIKRDVPSQAQSEAEEEEDEASQQDN